MEGKTQFAAGVIEGFFGRSWDWPARHSCADFLRHHGYQFYIYAPKSDPYLRRRWREPIGLSGLNAENCRDLLARYEAEPSNDYASDIAAWLRGDYVFDPQCLTT